MKSISILERAFYQSQFNQRRCLARKPPSRHPMHDPHVRVLPISFETPNGHVKLDAIIQDTMPQGSKLGTTIYVHGSPGTHRDCKYVVPHLQRFGIRFIGVNFPGFGVTLGDKRLTYTNQERINYVQAIIDKLDIQERIVFVGHSRGSENALKMSVLNKDRVDAVVLVNGVCLRPHRGVSPMWAIQSLANLCRNKVTALFGRAMVWSVYSSLRVPLTMNVASTAIQTISTVDLVAQKPFIDELNKSHIRSLILFSGADFLIQSDRSRHLASHFHGNKEIGCDRGKDEENSAVWRKLHGLLEEGNRSVSVHFTHEDHFLQIRRSAFLAQALHSLFLTRPSR